MCREINESIKVQYTLLTPQQTSVCSLVMDTLQDLGAAACFVPLIFSRTPSLLAHRALLEQTAKFGRFQLSSL